MNENEEALKKALAENSQFKAEKSATMQKKAAGEFSDKMKLTERILMIYLLLCVVFGVPVLNIFVLSGDLKTLITCLLVLVVVYETTVLLKLWYVVAGTKLSVLKEVKLLRLEVSQLSLATGRNNDYAMPSEKYDPAKGVSKIERRLWLVAIVVTAIVLGSFSGGGFAWLSGNNSEIDSKTLVTLNRDGSAVSTTDIVQERFGMHAAAINIFRESPNFPFYVPSSCKVRWFDEEGREMNFKTTTEGEQTCYDVILPATGAKVSYTYLVENPKATTQADNIWTYEGGSWFVGKERRFNTTVLLPEGAESVSIEPKPMLEFTSGKRRAVRFQYTLMGDEKFAYKLQYRLPTKAEKSNGE